MKKLLLIPIVGLQMLHAGGIQNLTVDQTISDSVKYKEKHYYTVSVPKGKYLKVNLTKLKADVDLYVKTGSKPTIRNNNCYSTNSYTKDETCTYKVESDERVYILVNGFKGSSYNLKASILDTDSITTMSVREKANKEIKKGESHKYKVVAKKGDRLNFALYNNGDADLRVKVGREAKLHVFDCKSTKGKNQLDECSVTLKKDATVYAYINGYHTNTSYTLYITGDNFPKNRLYTEDTRYFLAYRKVNRSTEVYIVNSETNKATYHRKIPGAFDFKKIKDVDIFKSTTNHSTLYTINSDGQLIDISDYFTMSANDISYTPHIDNFTTNKILKAQYLHDKKIIQHSFDVSNPLVPELVNKEEFNGKDALNFVAKYNCGNISHLNNKINAYKDSVICEESGDLENAAYILYNKKLTLINVNKPNNSPIETLEEAYFLKEKGDQGSKYYNPQHTLHKFNNNLLYVLSSQLISEPFFTEESIYSIYDNGKQLFILRQISYAMLSADISQIEIDNNKVTISVKWKENLFKDEKSGIKIYDISDIKAPKVIKDNCPKIKITFL